MGNRGRSFSWNIEKKNRKNIQKCLLELLQDFLIGSLQLSLFYYRDFLKNSETSTDICLDFCRILLGISGDIPPGISARDARAIPGVVWIHIKKSCYDSFWEFYTKPPNFNEYHVISKETFFFRNSSGDFNQLLRKCIREFLREFFHELLQGFLGELLHVCLLYFILGFPHTIFI